VREAIRKLEIYGIVKTRPQSGTFVAGIGISALETLISDVLQIDAYSFLSLVETREVLELSAVELACERRTEADLVLLEHSLKNYLDKVDRGVRAVEEDMMFHLTIADCAKNTVLKSMLLIIIPDILANYATFKLCFTAEEKAVQEHKLLFESIVKEDKKTAVKVMRDHLDGVMSFAKSIAQ
jgi:GntR family transcriptional repressor for pyruvate dehydrogenase complex